MSANTYIALLRGINVGGKNLLPMQALAAVLESLGATQIQTYIQSGNAVFQCAEKNAAKLSQRIGAGIKKHHDIEPYVLLLNLNAFKKAIAENPFPEAENNPTSLHLGFLAAPPTSVDTAKLNSVRSDSERFQLSGGIFYLHAPEGIGNSKLAARAEKHLGVPTTFRNWRTVCKIAEIAEAQ